ncbi:MAG TPA: RNA-splicing ligase RtcB, partial [Alphaproteobacteria bacterium]|nr:RNA-splicing ligase RtcB [Alphaproteobacteria bacterium]
MTTRTTDRTYDVIHAAEGRPIKAWVRGVTMEDAARDQLLNVARLPFIHKWVAAMPDVHWGIGATVGSVIPTHRAIIPAAVGVDIGCGMIAAKTTLTAEDLPDNLAPLRSAIERAVPHGRSPGANDPGAWNSAHKRPGSVDSTWAQLEPEFTELCRDYPKLEKTNHIQHLGTLGTGNHFIEVCLDEEKFVWFMLHSGSRGVGNAIGTMFIELARQDAMRQQKNLPDRDLAYLEEGSRTFGDYVRAVGWAQRFALLNRELMMRRVIEAAKTVIRRNFRSHVEAVNCHHNYVQKERHFGEDVYVTRKGAVSAKAGQLGIIPGSMGARSYIVRGKGHAESFESCSHGAGRVMSRGEAKRRFTLAEHRAATEGVECRKDKDVIDETPMAYKDID